MGKGFPCVAVSAAIMATMNVAMAADEQLGTTPAVCGSSELTQEKFLDMLHAIVMHGDLTDMPFIEKTLQTKLRGA